MEITGIITALVIGLIIGVLGRIVAPGRQNIPVWVHTRGRRRRGPSRHAHRRRTRGCHYTRH